MKTNQNHPCRQIRDLASSAPEDLRDLPAELAAHVRECVACQVEARASVRLVALLEHAGEPFQMAMTPEQLAKKARAAAAGNRTRAPGVRWWRPAVSFAVLALLVAGGWWWWRDAGGGDAGGISTRRPAPAGTRLAVTEARRLDREGKSTTLDAGMKAVKTGAGERAILTLSEGTRVWLNENTSVAMLDDAARSLRLEAGEILLDVVRQRGLTPLVVQTASGRVDVVGTRLFVSQLPGMAVVNVLRGHVVATSGGKQADVRAGGEAILRGEEAPITQAAANLGYASEWAQETPELPDETSGFGRLNARRPGAGADTELALRLIDHQVDVKIQGRVVRTEIEEEFMNDSDDTLEGIYTFPMPPDAQIAGLDLVVEGKWEHGAIVARDQGDKIWAGVLRNAAPKEKKKDVVEYVWVPGPWHDPALLNWKKGSQFELKIFPIPKKGSRRVRIAYTQLLAPIPGGNRYVLPLAAARQDQVAAEKFSFAATIGGVSDVNRLRISPLKPERRQENGAARLSLVKENFRPDGDLIIDIPDEKPGREIRAWTYRQPDRPEADGYALVTLKPILPATTGNDPLHVVLVVDRSYSMQRTRLSRAAELSRLLVGELDGTHRVTVVACNHACRTLMDGVPATDALAVRVHDELAALEPVGSSRLETALDEIGKVVTKDGEKAARTRVVWLTDGVPSVGETDPARLAKKAQSMLGRARLTTVGLGGETDEVVLRALARAGSGSVLTLTPGTRTAALAWKVLQRQLGVPVTGVKLAFPEGVKQVAPEKTELIWPGEEMVVAMRTPAAAVEGPLVITGELDGVGFRREYQVKLDPVAAAGNAFVPRIWAQGRIDDLQEKGGGADMIQEIVRLSKDHHVLSRYTSLLVLESPAMAKAFGVDDTRPAVDWTGTEEGQEAEVSGPPGSFGADLDDKADRMMGAGAPPATMPMISAPPAAKMSRVADEEMSVREMSRRFRGRRMIRMKKQWYRVATVTRNTDSAAADCTEVQKRRAALLENPESRDRLASLVRALIQSGATEEAEKLAKQWLDKDAMDAEALVVHAELALLRGDALRAIEILESAIDANPGSEAAHERLLGAHLALGDFPMMCAHAVTRALIAPKNWEHQAMAAQCTLDVDRFLAHLPAGQRARAERKMKEETRPTLRRDALNLEATWEGDAQLDLVVVTPEGRVVSFAGGARRVHAIGAQSPLNEQLAASMEKRGRYQIFAVPRQGGKTPAGSARGQVKIASYNAARILPFMLGPARVRVADVVVSSAFRLVPADPAR